MKAFAERLSDRRKMTDKHYKEHILGESQKLLIHFDITVFFYLQYFLRWHL